MPNKFENIIENIKKYDIVLLPYECEHDKSLKEVLKSYKNAKKALNNIAVIIGPEGGFEEKEVNTLLQFPNVMCVTLRK